MSTNYGVQQERDWNALSDEDFRQIIRAEFEANYPSHLRYQPRRLRWSEVGDWYRRMAGKGWIAPNWPVEYGGMGLAAAKMLIFLEEQERWGIGRYQDQGVNMVGPILIQYGTPEQQQRYLPGMLSCDELWCQGYSEPNAGSDLASLRTRAERDGDEFVINGHKIWTTLAHDASHMFVLARTDPNVKKQQGISFLLIDITSPGITVRPIRNLAGHEEFCEVFFDDARTPVTNLVGGLNEGWTVAKSLLGHERIFIGSPKLPEFGLQVLESVARSRGVSADPVFRDRLTQLKLDVEHLGVLYRKYAGIVAAGGTLGPDVSLLKVWATETFQRIADLIFETAGSQAALKGMTGAPGEVVDALGMYYRARSPTIFAGSNEIQRNILAKRVLDLPS